jgi:tetratricopeptide (TPR) repeat protein
MRLYAEGLEKLRAFDALRARDLLLRAVDADPSYPLAHASLARAWMALGYNQNAVTEAKKAVDLAGKLSREDHALVEARYYEASKDWEKAIDTYRALFASFPDNLEYGLYLTNAQIGGERSSDALNTVAKLRGQFAEARSDPRIDLAEAEAAFLLSDNKRVLVATDRAVIKANASGAKLLAARARALQCRALANLGQSQQSLAAGAEARRLYHQAGDLSGEAQALHSMAEVPLNQGDLEQAKQLYEQALELARKVGDQRAAGRELGNIGLILIQQGDLATGEKFYNEALVNFREVGDKHLMSVVTGNMGDIRHAEGRLGEALAEYRDALVLAREVGHRASEAIDLQLIGDVLADQGDLNGAMQMYQQASAIQREIGDKTYYSETLASIGRLRRQKADSEGAKKAYEEARGIRQQLGEKGLSAEVDVSLGELACDSGQAAVAERLARGAIQEYQAEKETDSELQAQSLLIAALLQQGRAGEAEKAVARGLALSKGSSYVTVRLPFTLQNAYATAAAGNLAEAERMARDVRMEADKFGLVPIQLEASLAIGRIRRNTAQLTELARNARARGFELIARKASAAALSSRPRS